MFLCNRFLKLCDTISYMKCNNSFEVSTFVDGIGDAVEPDLRSVRIRVVVRSGVLFLEPQFAACRPHIDEGVPCVFRYRARRLDTPLALSFRLQYVRSIQVEISKEAFDTALKIGLTWSDLC